MSEGRDVPQRSLDRYGFLHDPDGRRLRARRIVAALADFGGVDIVNARVLDIGCSAGLITEEVARSAAWVVGVDVDFDALAHAASLLGAAHFVHASATRLPFAEGTFDAVVCNHVYEHVSDPLALMWEVHRVLRSGGACYFAGGHRLQLIEPHYRLPFLSWLPRRSASAWIRRRGYAARYEEMFVVPWRLRRLFVAFSSAKLISPAMLREPRRYGFPRLAQLPRMLQFGVAVSSGLVAWLAPTWIFLLRR
ncbi:MAG: class I SAM-dependent methyltransferase [Casimicrobiaceae bacterium]